MIGILWQMNEPRGQIRRYLREGDYIKAVHIYNTKIRGTSSEEKYNDMFLSRIDEIIKGWETEQIGYKEAVATLDEIGSVEQEEISKEAGHQSYYIALEGKCREYHDAAAAYFEKRDYIAVMQTVLLIDSRYSGYQNAMTLYDDSMDMILADVSHPKTVREYERYIAVLQNYLEIIDEPAFGARKAELEEEVIHLREIVDIIRNADVQYADARYKEAFALLENAMRDYPYDGKLEEHWIMLHKAYVEDITGQAKLLCEAEEYNDALELAEAAIEEHDCEELQLLRDDIRAEKNILFRLKKKIVKIFSVFQR